MKNTNYLKIIQLTGVMTYLIALPIAAFMFHPIAGVIVLALHGLLASKAATEARKQIEENNNNQ